jgi:lysophospholipase L1-like esterase
MHYVALGDSISIDDYTGVHGGGAASQLARHLAATRFQDLTRDGNVASAVLIDLARIEGRPDVVTLTVGGNNLLLGEEPEAILPVIEGIAEALARLQARVVLNTVYDPSDGDDFLAERTGLSRELRERHRALNEGIRQIAARYGFLLADLEALFHGHGIASSSPWYVMVIEPNYQGATAIAGYWRELLRGTEDGGRETGDGSG